MPANKDLWLIDPQKTALLCVDMELGDKLGKSPRVLRHAADPAAMFRYMNEYMVPRINELAAACRQVGMPVLWMCSGMAPDGSDAGIGSDFATFGGDGKTKPPPLEDRMLSHEIHPDLNVLPGDLIIRKKRYSAFIRGSSNLEETLHKLGRNAFIAVGEATDVCLGMTVMDAMMLDFKVFVLSDLVATYSKARQENALELLDHHFAKIMTFAAAMKKLGELAGKTSKKGNT